MSDLWPHQKIAIDRAMSTRDLGLFWEMGTGKTRATIDIIRYKFSQAQAIRKTLILAPAIVCQNWFDEFLKYSKIHSKDILVLKKSEKERCRWMLKSCGEELNKARIVVTNYEAMEMQDLFKILKMWRPEILICDESQRIKNHTSKRARKVLELAMNTHHNYILTGTPILNSPMDLFMQFAVLDRGETFGGNFFSFRGAYFHDENDRWKGKQGYFPKWAIRPGAEGAIQEKIQKKSIRVLKKDCLDLPPLVRQVIYTDLSTAQIKAYKQMYHDYITFIESSEGAPRAVVAELAVTKALRLQQIVSGFVKDDKGDIHRLDCPRLKVLQELLCDIAEDNKVIIWSEFKENQKMVAELCNKMGLGYREIHGDIPNQDRYKNMDDFRTDPHVRVMIANQSAGGVGINLVEASYAIYFSKGFKLENDLQSEARNYRGGSEIHEKVTRIDIVAKGTIDELVTEALQNKLEISDRILQWKDRLGLRL